MARRKLTDVQRAWLINYAKTTGFEALYVEDYTSGAALTWEHVQLQNIRWFENWAWETTRALRRDRTVEPLLPIIGFTSAEGYDENVVIVYLDEWAWAGMFSAIAGEDLFEPPPDIEDAQQACAAYALGQEAMRHCAPYWTLSTARLLFARYARIVGARVTWAELSPKARAYWRSEAASAERTGMFAAPIDTDDPAFERLPSKAA